MNWLHALLNVGQGAAEAAARKQMESAPRPRRGGGEAPCTPCQAKANAQERFARHGLRGVQQAPRRRLPG